MNSEELRRKVEQKAERLNKFRELNAQVLYTFNLYREEFEEAVREYNKSLLNGAVYAARDLNNRKLKKTIQPYEQTYRKRP